MQSGTLHSVFAIRAKAWRSHSILDWRFWILDWLHQTSVGLENFRLMILDEFRPEGAGLVPKISNLKSKIQNLKFFGQEEENSWAISPWIYTVIFGDNARVLKILAQ
jgi:hypothetical protein